MLGGYGFPATITLGGHIVVVGRETGADSGGGRTLDGTLGSVTVGDGCVCFEVASWVKNSTTFEIAGTVSLLRENEAERDKSCWNFLLYIKIL